MTVFKIPVWFRRALAGVGFGHCLPLVASEPLSQTPLGVLNAEGPAAAEQGSPFGPSHRDQYALPLSGMSAHDEPRAPQAPLIPAHQHGAKPPPATKPLPPIPAAPQSTEPRHRFNSSVRAAAAIASKLDEIKTPPLWRGRYVVDDGRRIRSIEGYCGTMYGTSLGGTPWVSALARTDFSNQMVPVLCTFEVYDKAKGGREHGGEDWVRAQEKWPL